MKKIVFVIWLLLMYSALSAPKDEECKAFVERVLEWSVDDRRAAVEWEEAQKHKADFSAEFYSLMEWVSTPHRDVEGRDWHYGVDPIWQVQASEITEVKIGTPTMEGERWLVPVDFVSPSPLSPDRPPTYLNNTWVLASQDGRLILEDVRYRVKAPAENFEGSALEDMRRVKEEYRAP